MSRISFLPALISVLFLSRASTLTSSSSFFCSPPIWMHDGRGAFCLPSNLLDVIVLCRSETMLSQQKSYAGLSLPVWARSSAVSNEDTLSFDPKFYTTQRFTAPQGCFFLMQKKSFCTNKTDASLTDPLKNLKIQEPWDAGTFSLSWALWHHVREVTQEVTSFILRVSDVAFWVICQLLVEQLQLKWWP